MCGGRAPPDPPDAAAVPLQVAVRWRTRRTRGCRRPFGLPDDRTLHHARHWVGRSGGVTAGRCSSMRRRSVGGTMRPVGALGAAGAGAGGGATTAAGGAGAGAGPVRQPGARALPREPQQPVPGAGSERGGGGGGGGATGSGTCSTTGSGAGSGVGSGTGASSMRASSSTSCTCSSCATGRGRSSVLFVRGCRRGFVCVLVVRMRGGGLAVFTRRGGGSTGPVGLTGSGAFFVSVGFFALLDRRFRKDVAGRQRDVALLREAVDELTRHDLFDRARGALDFDPVIPLQQRGHFLARRAQELRNLVNPTVANGLPQHQKQSCYSALSPARGVTRVAAARGVVAARAAARIFSAVLSPMPEIADSCSTVAAATASAVLKPASTSFTDGPVADTGEREGQRRGSAFSLASSADWSSAPVPPSRPSNWASTSRRFSSSLLMSMRQPVELGGEADVLALLADRE